MGIKCEVSTGKCGASIKKEDGQKEIGSVKMNFASRIISSDVAGCRFKTPYAVVLMSSASTENAAASADREVASAFKAFCPFQDSPVQITPNPKTPS